MGHRLHAYIIMPDHIHLVVTPKEGKTISQLMHSFKLYTARQIGDLLKMTGGIWQSSFYEHALRSSQDVENIMEYIHNNPVRANLISSPEQYRWSSYRACVLGEQVPIEIDLLEY